RAAVQSERTRGGGRDQSAVCGEEHGLMGSRERRVKSREPELFWFSALGRVLIAGGLSCVAEALFVRRGRAVRWCSWRGSSTRRGGQFGGQISGTSIVLFGNLVHVRRTLINLLWNDAMCFCLCL